MNLRDANVLITGGAGLIGSTLADLLLAADSPRRIVVIDNFCRGTRRNLELALASGRVELVEADIRDFAAIRPHFDGIGAVFHQAAIRITRCAEAPRECLEVMIDGTYNVLEACVAAKVRKVVAASSASVYGMADAFPTPESHASYNNRTWYGAAKTANEAALRAFHEMYGLDYVALRYFNVYGPRMDIFGKYTEVIIRWLEAIDRGEPLKIFGDGLQTMDFVYTGDIARANRLAMESPHSDRVYNVARGEEISLLELAEAVAVAAGVPGVQREHLPERSVNPVARRWADTRLAERELGFRAETPLADGLRALVRWRREMLARAADDAAQAAAPASSLAEGGGRR